MNKGKQVLSFFLLISVILFGVYVGKANIDSLPLCGYSSQSGSAHSTLSSIQSANLIPIEYSSTRYSFSEEIILKSQNKHIQPRIVIGAKEYTVTLIFIMALCALLKRIERFEFSLPFKSFLSVIHYIHNKDGSKPVLG